jgi:hypothetical protein
VIEVKTPKTDDQSPLAPSGVPAPNIHKEKVDPELLKQAVYATQSEETDAAIDQIVGHWTELRHEKATKEEEAEAERERFLDNFRKLDEAIIQPAMEATLTELRKDGGGGQIDVRKEDLMHRPRVTLWLSLEGEIKGTPDQGKNPYLQLDADVAHRQVAVWEGDMWMKEGVSRDTAPFKMDEITTESITERILGILKRAATHGVAA